MDSQEALAFINKLLANDKQVLNELEQKLFLGMWERKAYKEIVNDGSYSAEHVRDVGANLCKKIGVILEIQVKKRNFRNPIIAVYQQYSEQALPSQVPILEPTNPSPRHELHSYHLSQQNHNPFIPLNGRVEENYLFFDREREIRRVFEVLNSGSSIVLIGEEGIGKSSLLWMIYQEAENRLNVQRQPVFLDLNLLHNETQFYSNLCHEIGIDECQGYQLTRNLRSCKILLAIDNVGKLTGEGFTRNIRDYLRGLAEGNNAPLKLILAATEPLNNLFKDSQDQGNTSPLAGICQEEQIHPWDKDTIRTFISSRLARTTVNFTEEEIVQLIQESGGHPRKLMQFCYQTYSRYVESLQ
ncbi:ATP-binding protein [Desmonostoc muscorum LEGE 12446]|uniref:ATP-binding protein n=1 Tax=Desmonostoc muscorum LEGE 12446 TaxID=1828758 RepID=A0A8J7AEJ8_DESMC|nr:ATP-binding protein [Desmonostoc muscorum]MCF2149515.1 ATP-binding protein [Desmonostoc muscorum LEGE 12446]